jgi:hypothetical protein
MLSGVTKTVPGVGFFEKVAKLPCSEPGIFDKGTASQIGQAQSGLEWDRRGVGLETRDV